MSLSPCIFYIYALLSLIADPTMPAIDGFDPLNVGSLSHSYDGYSDCSSVKNYYDLILEISQVAWFESDSYGHCHARCDISRIAFGVLNVVNGELLFA